MYHSISFCSEVALDGSLVNEYNTWTDWHIIPSTRPIVNSPGVKTQLIDLPGSDGYIDMTEVLSGRTLYGSRQGTWTFIAHPDYVGDSLFSYEDIKRILHGKSFYVVLEDDDEYFYEGRMSVNQFQPGANWGQLTIDYTLKPFKKERLNSTMGWIWDRFSFKDGIIRTYTNIPIYEYGELLVPVGDEPISTNIIVFSQETTITAWLGDSAHELALGNNVFDNYKIRGANNLFKFYGTGVIGIDLLGRAGWI